MSAFRILAIAICCQFMLYGSGSGAEIAASTANLDALLGGAYKSDRELFVGQNCVAGTQVLSGAPVATFSFEQALSEAQASDALGFSVGGRARFGVVEASAAARFMKNSVSSDFSVSAVWLSEYVLPTTKLTNVTLSEIGNAVKPNFERWNNTCGDEFVTEIRKGGRLFFSIRVDFNSKEQKQEFQASFSLSGPLYSAQSDLSTASRSFSKNSKVTISALQMGGDVSQVTSIFAAAPEGRAGFVQCSLGDFAKCAAVVSAALDYATNTRTGFPAQLKDGATPGPASLIYKTVTYSAAGLYSNEYPGLSEAIRLSRSRLSSAFEEHLKLAVTADRLVETGIEADRLAPIVEQRHIIDQNISAILQSSKVCYERPEDCTPAVSGLKLAEVDRRVFILPPLPNASYSLLTLERGVWSRADSVDVFRQCQDSRLLFACDLQQKFEGRPEPYSVALKINGVGLREARIYFEERLLKKVPFVAQGSFPEKFGKDYALLIVDSTRHNVGWRDVDTDALRASLWFNDLPRADGVFYAEVLDAFGRTARFDISYEKWNVAVSKEGGMETTKADLFIKNKWWLPNSPGTSLRDPGPWSSDFHFKISVRAPQGTDIKQLLVPSREFCFRTSLDPGACIISLEQSR